jgi:glycerophosphoryl diester phosphodiesterase
LAKSLEPNVTKPLSLPKVIAHRGAKSYAPENTLAAFKLAAEKGASWVEFDVQLSRDNQLFVFHDDDLRRTTLIKGLARDLTLAELKKCDAGSWFNDKFANEPIPSLSETMDLLIKCQLNANIEIKSCGDQEYDKRLAMAVCEYLKQLPEDLPIKLLVSSFSFDCLEIVRNELPNMPIGMLLEVTRWHHFMDHVRDIKGLYHKLNCSSLNINQDILTKDRIKLLDFAEQIACYTVNKRDRAEHLFSWGVDSVFSDHVDLLNKFI